MLYQSGEMVEYMELKNNYPSEEGEIGFPSHTMYMT